MPDNAARAAGFAVLSPGVYLATPTRRHRVVTQQEADRWIAWAVRHNEDGSIYRQWDLYRGQSLRRALDAGVRFARRLSR